MSINVSDTEGFRLRDGKIETVTGHVLEIPNIRVEKAIGGGANGEVFQGVDLLGRKVAIKIWKTYTAPRGFERALAEVRKLAALEDHGRIFAHVYHFGEFPVPNQPEQRIAYAVLEYVDGLSGAAWLQNNPDFKARYAVWKLIRTALSFIYRQGMVHGDPHLENVVVLPEAKAHFKEFLPAGLGIPKNNTPWELGPWVTLPPLGVKLIDLGSSLLWEDHDKFIARERKKIREDFKKLLPEIGSAGADKRAIRSSPGMTLDAFDVWLEYSLIVEAPLQNRKLANRHDGRSYDDLIPLERQVRDLLFDRPLVSISVLKKHMQQLGFNYATLLGDEFETIQNDYIERRQTGLI